MGEASPKGAGGESWKHIPDDIEVPLETPKNHLDLTPEQQETLRATIEAVRKSEAIAPGAPDARDTEAALTRATNEGEVITMLEGGSLATVQDRKAALNELIKQKLPGYDAVIEATQEDIAAEEGNVINLDEKRNERNG